MKIEVGLTGHFTIDVHNPETGKHRTYEFENLITNGGLERMGSTGGSFEVISHVQVGTGSTAPSVTDSALNNFLASTGKGGSGAPTYTYNAVYGGSPTFHTEGTFTWRFDQGAAAGNLSEIGVGWASGGLFSRALIVDGSGNPTTITVAAIEFLTVTYKLRMYPPTTDVTGSISMGGTTYDYTIRAASAGGQYWSSVGRAAFGSVSGVEGFSEAFAYTGDIGAVSGGPTGTISAAKAVTFSAYSAGSLKRVANISCSISEWNLSIRSVLLGVSGSDLSYSGNYHKQMAWQCQFNPALPKDNTKTLSLTFEVAWARKP